MPEYMDPEEVNRIKKTEWWELISPADAKKQFASNIKLLHAAFELRKNPRRPIQVLAIHGSPRSNVELSCAHELSNSQLLLRYGLKAIEGQPDVRIKEVNLREMFIEPCNSCYSSTSAMCHLGCSCFPFDDASKMLFPMVIACDVLLLSTGVNQSAMSSRLKLFCDRLINLDGGYYLPPEQYVPKDLDMKNRMTRTSLRQPVHYDQRMHGRVVAFFISSKDNSDELPANDYRDTLPSYVKTVADSLARGFLDYGMKLSDPWLAQFSAVVDEEMSYDKFRLAIDTNAQEQAKRVVAAAVELARAIRERPPARGPHPPNRT